jgi:hypothetical protein
MAEMQRHKLFPSLPTRAREILNFSTRPPPARPARPTRPPARPARPAPCPARRPACRPRPQHLSRLPTTLAGSPDPGSRRKSCPEVRCGPEAGPAKYRPKIGQKPGPEAGPAKNRPEVVHHTVSSTRVRINLSHRQFNKSSNQLNVTVVVQHTVCEPEAKPERE